jgi:hypothetical protein
LVIQAHAGARATYEIARQLSEALPIESADDFSDKRPVSLAGHKVSSEDLKAVLPEEVFPIRDQSDLVAKVAAAVRVAEDVLSHEGGHREMPKRIAPLAEQLAVRPRAQVGAGFFGGPSVLGSEREES